MLTILEFWHGAVSLFQAFVAMDDQVQVYAITVQSWQYCGNSNGLIKLAYNSTKGVVRLKIQNIPFVKLSHSLETSVTGNYYVIIKRFWPYFWRFVTTESTENRCYGPIHFDVHRQSQGINLMKCLDKPRKLRPLCQIDLLSTFLPLIVCIWVYIQWRRQLWEFTRSWQGPGNIWQVLL